MTQPILNDVAHRVATEATPAAERFIEHEVVAGTFVTAMTASKILKCVTTPVGFLAYIKGYVSGGEQEANRQIQGVTQWSENAEREITQNIAAVGEVAVRAIRPAAGPILHQIADHAAAAANRQVEEHLHPQRAPTANQVQNQQEGQTH